jgi:hypothetical protein
MRGPLASAPGERGALLHAARQLLRIVVLEADQPDLADVALRDLELLARGSPRR